MLVRSGFPFNYDTNVASDESGLECRDATMTQQQFAEECDINTIVERFGIGYEAPEGVRLPSYADFTEALDFQQSLNVLNETREAFMGLHADVRARFNNDPQRFFEFFNDERNRAEAERLGLVVAKPVELPAEPLQVIVVPSEPAAPG